MLDLRHGDCLAVMREMPDASVSAVVTDPPYGLSFMNKHWDYSVPSVEIWRECLRVLKPGGYLLAFAGTRTQHRMAVNIEDAGFEIRDMIAWVYGSGFPKSKNVGDGWGTALKPALEPVTVARKPFQGTVAANVLQHGTGGLNIDGCRIAHGEDLDLAAVQNCQTEQPGHTVTLNNPGSSTATYKPGGRWPANLIHDGSDEVTELFPQSKGQQGDVKGTEPSSKTDDIYGQYSGRTPASARNDTGSAARFFYCAKASKGERGGSNTHPTVKPIALMRYLIRLVTPPDGIVLDPFMGSGTTGIAAILENVKFVGIERDEESHRIAVQRVGVYSRIRQQELAL